MIILDNMSIHKSRLARKALRKISGVELKYLPTNAPWLNPVETIFSSFQKACIAGVRFEVIEEIRGKIRSFLKRENGEDMKINHRFWSKSPPPVLAGCTILIDGRCTSKMSRNFHKIRWIDFD